VYNFKKIGTVPTGKDFVDIVLSRTQRKTPTVIHKGYSIKRIKAFYMRKVKYTQQSFHDKISKILEDFPRMDDIHPFYADLMNVLYDRDHYKLALGQMNIARQIVDKLAKDYVRMLKYADTLYRAKQLKVAALGRMATVMKKHGPSLAYLEQVRQHLSRLPSIDPNARTLLVTGYPNVGKSSFVNKMTNANVEVEPYAFTTKSLYIGHMDYRYSRWQVIDTPGILDHPLEERNTIEMQAITALAHLRACVLYFLDPSEECGFTMEQQIQLFENIKPLFANKPLVVVANKSDLLKVTDLPQDKQDRLNGIIEGDTHLINTSTMTEAGLADLKEYACGKLLEFRVNGKMKMKKTNDIMNMLHVAQPKARDNKTRAAAVPAGVAERAQARAERKARKEAAGADAMEEDDEETVKTEKDLMLENGGAGVYSCDFTKHWQLADPSWRTDAVPEIMDGKNIADFIDPNIEEMLAELEAEEDELLRLEGEAMDDEEDEEELDTDEEEAVAEIKDFKGKTVAKSRISENSNKAVLPKKNQRHTLADFKSHLATLGITKDVDAVAERVRSRSRTRTRGEKRGRSETPDRDRSKSRGRSATPSRNDLSLTSSKKPKLLEEAVAQMKKAQKKLAIKQRSEADRVYGDKKPKWQFTGKMDVRKSRNHR